MDIADKNRDSQSRPFAKLADPAGYQPTSWNLAVDAEGRRHWVDFFKRHFVTIMKPAVESAARRDAESAEARAAACMVEFNAHFDDFAANPAGRGRVTVLTLDRWRDGILRRHGFFDPFLDVKNRENERMLPMLAGVCAELDSLAGRAQLDAAILGILAGNIFDLGVEATAKAFLDRGPDFYHIRATLSPRPWLIDDYDSLAIRLLDGPIHRKAVFFIDNAGSDFVLGVTPMIRWLAKRGTMVIMAANERPTLNDMCVTDVRAWWPRLLAAEPSLGDLPISLVSTGTGEPLIDLSEVSRELNTVAADADLVILEGMGRGVESNLEARFSCDAVNIAMIKDAIIASRHGGKIYDVVCKFRLGVT